MESIYISKIIIKKVRHLKEIEIMMDPSQKKHLILTGKNGSGKTSLLNSMAQFLNSLICSDDLIDAMRNLEADKNNFQHAVQRSESEDAIKRIEKRIKHYQEQIDNSTGGIWMNIIPETDTIRSLFQKGEFIVAYYQADRIFSAVEPKHVEKVELKNEYTINDTPGNEFIKYLLDLKMTEALSLAGGKKEKAAKIKTWFDSFEVLLKKIFEDDSLQLMFDEDTFKFSIHINGREPFDFNTLSGGYAAVLDIVIDLIIRMEKHLDKRFDFSTPGIVLIDEIETHLHLDLQKKILGLLTTVFPDIQFIVSTHSPFILNSLENAVIYDLENKILVKNGLSDVPYSGIVEGYFKSNELSLILENKYNRYRELVHKQTLTEEDYDEIADLEMYLNEIPDYLALRITTEYQRLKQYLRNREDS